jgi:uncharacterized alpha-E superfamily protein
LSETLLARYAESLFWLARYVERVENLARILDVNETFSRDSRGDQNWRSVVHLFADQERFARYHDAINADTVLDFYVRDRANPTSIVSAMRSARENARTLRPMISTEMWVQLNVFYNRLSALTGDALQPGNRARLFGEIKDACQTHTGITEGTMYQDQGWHFYQMGRYLERADQTTRLLDIKYHLLLPQPSDVSSPLDVSQWNALLRSAAGYHAYRRVYPRGISPASVAGFLLLNKRFPRSVRLCLGQAEAFLSNLKARYTLRGGRGAAEELDGLRGLLDSLAINDILTEGLHEFLDSVQLRLIAVSGDLSASFFGQ